MTRFPHDDEAAGRGYDFGGDADPAPHDDPQFDAWIARQAPSINAPNATPREDMWAAIQAAQQTHAAAATGAVAGVHPLHRRWRLPAVIAAALLLGVALDRIALQSGEPGASQGAARVVTVAEPNVPDSLPDAARDSDVGRSSGAGTDRTPGSERRVASNDVVTPNSPLSTRSSATPESFTRTPEAATDVNRLYRLAAVQTLSQAEALLTSYRATDLATRDPAAARQLGTWGRDVLSSTRLLIDSPAGSDPQLRSLLVDLELVLVQIVRLSGTPLDESDRALIDRALRDRDLVPRIRTAVPAGAASTTSED